MFHIFLRPQTGPVVLLFWAMALAVYLIMVLGPLAHLTEIASGPVFDMRPAGYSLDEAVTILDRLGDTGRQIYVWQQLPLDLIYPALFAMASSATLIWLAARVVSGGRWYRMLAVAGLIAAGFDYAENVLIYLLLHHGAVEPFVGIASAMSVAKAGFTTIALSAILYGAMHMAIGRVTTRHP